MLTWAWRIASRRGLGSAAARLAALLAALPVVAGVLASLPISSRFAWPTEAGLGGAVGNLLAASGLAAGRGVLGPVGALMIWVMGARTCRNPDGPCPWPVGERMAARPDEASSRWRGSPRGGDGQCHPFDYHYCRAGCGPVATRMAQERREPEVLTRLVPPKEEEAPPVVTRLTHPVPPAAAPTQAG